VNTGEKVTGTRVGVGSRVSVGGKGVFVIVVVGKPGCGGREKDRLRRCGSTGRKKDTKKKYLDGFTKRHEGDCTKPIRHKVDKKAQGVIGHFYVFKL
jgi:hypothetical protein